MSDDLVVARTMDAAKLEQWRKKNRRVERGVSRPLMSRRASEPQPAAAPKKARPEEAHSYLVDSIWKAMRRSKEDWETHVKLLRRAAPHLVGHLTDGQVADLLKQQFEDEVKKTYHRMGRGNELKIKLKGF